MYKKNIYRQQKLLFSVTDFNIFAARYNDKYGFLGFL